MAEALATLASTGGTALVTVMVTDSWESIKGSVARLFGRGDGQQTEAAQARLEQSRAALDGLAGAELGRARAEQEIVWRTRLTDLLEAHPQAAGELKSLIGAIQAQATHSAGPVVQHATAYDQAQQVVLGHGVQNVTFGARPASHPTTPGSPCRAPVCRASISANAARRLSPPFPSHRRSACGTTGCRCAAATSGFLAAMRSLGRRLGVTDEELRHGDAADVVWQRLFTRAETWLLVIDNAGEPAILAGAGSSAAEGRGWVRRLPTTQVIARASVVTRMRGSWRRGSAVCRSRSRSPARTWPSPRTFRRRSPIRARSPRTATTWRPSTPP